MMNLLVPVKRVIDPYVKIHVNQDGVELANVKMAMNPFDEIALEEALRFKEKNQAEKVIAVSIGKETCTETLRHALALGADRAILIRTEEDYESLNIAKILQKIVQDETITLVFMGKQSIDGDNNQTPQMLAGLLDWPQATFASHIESQENALLVTREIDGGLETLCVQLPAIVSVDLRLNTPRYASLPNIMKAKNKPLDIRDEQDLGLPLSPHRKVLQVGSPNPRKGGVLLDSVDALLDKLRHEAKVL
jgi:electron transfer flavoprotein beta subunit